MKQLYSLFLMCLVAITTTAQTPTLAQLLRWQRKAAQTTTRSGSTPLAFPRVACWVGSGPDSAALVLAWNDGLATDTLVWGYRFDATQQPSGADMLEAIVKADPRLYARVSLSAFGLYLEGLGYDRNGDASQAVTSLGITLHHPLGWNVYAKAGASTTADTTDHYRGGYDGTTGRYLAYHSGTAGAALQSSPVGASSRKLTNGAIDVWTYQTWSDPFTLTSYTPAPKTPTFMEGVYIVNEDWFGKKLGSINFYDATTRTIAHNIHDTITPHLLGITTQYATLHAGRLYLMSKQAGQGNRLTVLNAATMTPIDTFPSLSDGGDGRAFAAINDTLAYVSTSKGLLAFDLTTNTFGQAIAGISGEVGLVQRFGAYAFVHHVKDNNIIVLDPATHSIVKTFKGRGFAQSKDGRVWVIAADKLLQSYDPTTLEVGDSIALATSMPNSSFAWNAGTFFAGNQANTLYYAAAQSGWSANAIYKIDLTAETPEAILLANVSTLGGLKSIYGAAIRLRPADDHIFYTEFSDYGSKQYNLVELSPEGEVVARTAFEPHYWFPAHIVFTDSYAPTLTPIAAQSLTLGRPDTTLTLTATDADSYDIATTFTASTADANIVTTALTGRTLSLTPQAVGETQVTIMASNSGFKSYTAFAVSVTDTPTSISSATAQGALHVAAGELTAIDLAGHTLSIYTLDGRLVSHTLIASNHFTTMLPTHHTPYIIKAGSITLKVQP
ncbi:MAG: DUF5074 domain-containing protein [Bacteroidales bacterium]|nr:DUF5074 domain-containing protein [Bacteroidales bacterium]